MKSDQQHGVAGAARRICNFDIGHLEPPWKDRRLCIGAVARIAVQQVAGVQQPSSQRRRSRSTGNSLRRMVALGGVLAWILSWSTEAIAENKTISVQPLFMFAANGLGAEFMSLEEAFAAISAVWNHSNQYGSRTAVNLHPYRPDYFRSYNGYYYTNKSDRYDCYTDGRSCDLSPELGPEVWLLSPRCPEERFYVNGKEYRYKLTDITGNDGLARRVRCDLVLPKLEADPKSCPIGNPVYPATGEKVRFETDYPGAGNTLQFKRVYRGNSRRFSSILTAELVDNASGTRLPGCFPGTYIENTSASRDYCFPYLFIEATVTVSSDAGRELIFYGSPPSPMPRADVNDRLEQRSVSAGGVEWQLRSEDNRFDIYSSAGALIRRVRADDSSGTIYSYSDSGTPIEIAPRSGLMIEAADPFGRKLRFAYDAEARLTQMTDPAGGVYRYSYDGAGSLASVTYADGAWRTYVYNESANINGGASCPGLPYGLRQTLTGILDNGARYGSFHYNCTAQVVVSELAGGVNRYGFSYSGSSTTVTDPSGASRQMSFSDIRDWRLALSSTQPAGSGCAASSRAISYDANGYKASEDDFNGKRVCYANDLTRNLETSRVEGLSSAATCGTYTAANASLPTGSRKVTTQWHPDWRLETKVAEPARITTSVYNGQPDPFSGGAVASCAPSDALLPDGKSIAVLCRQVEQATTDANGSQGFSAALQAGVANREQRWTYNRYGQVLTHDGPRSDVNDLTTYAYYADSSFTGSVSAAVGHTLGDLQSITNAAGQITQYTKYNKHGQLLESVGPNGVVTTHTYDLRQRLLSTTGAGQTTSYTYDAAGQLTRITWPDASFIGYEYDPAHRQTAVYDQLGNRIEYTLDNAGNRIAENVKDPGGTLSRQLSRSIDALGRVQQATGRE